MMILLTCTENSDMFIVGTIVIILSSEMERNKDGQKVSSSTSVHSARLRLTNEDWWMMCMRNVKKHSIDGKLGKSKYFVLGNLQKVGVLAVADIGFIVTTFYVREHYIAWTGAKSRKKNWAGRESWPAKNYSIK